LIWHTENKLGIGVRDIVDQLEEEGIFKAIIVADEGLTTGCPSILENVEATKNIIIDIWNLEESMIYAPDHVIVPEHRICSTKEKNHLMRVYALKKKQLPSIKRDDVQVKYMGASKGQLIEILRPSE